ncbi:MAG: hypothetical protein ABI359_08265 [Ginsengibacter sp.]
MESNNKFELDYNDVKIIVQRHSIGAQTVFRISFVDKRAPLVITRTISANSNRFWTSIPEGRQRESEEIGLLISEYYKLIK